MDAYDSKTASRIVGVSLRQIQYWDEQGFIRPSVKLADGRGTKRLYSFHDLICLKVVKDLTHHGLSLQKVRRCLRPLREYTVGTGRPSASLKYLTDGEKLFVITNNRKKILDISLTSRNKNQDSSVPLCGVPYHSAEPYIQKLLEAGHKVAVCEQVEDPKSAKGVVQREVIRVITPGTVTAAEALDARGNNFLCAIYK